MEANIIEKLGNQHKDLSKAQIEGILYLILSDSDLALTKLVLITGLPKPVLVDVVKSIDYLLDSSSERLTFTQEVKEHMLAQELKPYEWVFKKEVDTELAKKHAQLREKYFFTQKREYDQFFADAETSISKSLAIKAKSGLKGTKIALLGDDDLLSFALPMLSQDYTELVVFDIDKDQLAKIEAAAQQESYKNIKTVYLDARDAIPARYRNYFDVVFTDPPYTKSGFDLFLDRCIQLAKLPKDYNGSYIYICYGIGLKNTEREVKLLKSIYSRNLYLEEKLSKFNKYQGAETVGNASSLYILKTTPFTATVQNPLVENIYTFENVKEEKFPFVDHYVFKVHGVDESLLKSKTKLTAIFGDFCSKHKLKVMNTYITQFKPFGFSLTYILANSNLIVHTWQEYGAVHIDLVTCSPVHNAAELSTNLKALLKARSIDYYKVA